MVTMIDSHVTIERRFDQRIAAITTNTSLSDRHEKKDHLINWLQICKNNQMHKIIIFFAVINPNKSIV